MGDPEDSGGRKGTGGRRERELVEVTDSEVFSHCRDAKELHNLLFLGLGDVGLVLNVSS